MLRISYSPSFANPAQKSIRDLELETYWHTSILSDNLPSAFSLWLKGSLDKCPVQIIVFVFTLWARYYISPYCWWPFHCFSSPISMRCNFGKTLVLNCKNFWNIVTSRTTSADCLDKQMCKYNYRSVLLEVDSIEVGVLHGYKPNTTETWTHRCGCSLLQYPTPPFPMLY